MTTARRRLLPIVAAVITLVGCTGSAAPVSPSAGPPSAPPAAGPSQNGADLPTTDPGAGAGASGNSGSGVADPGPPTGPGGPNDPGGGSPQLVRPRPGQKDPHPVAATKLEASVDGRHVLVKVSWYSGVEPCSVLDSVRVERTGSEIAITPLEGMGDPGAVCIEIAVLKATVVDLGELEPGSYRIVAPSGDAPPLQVTVN